MKEDLFFLLLFIVFGLVARNKQLPQVRLSFLILQVIIIYLIGFKEKPWHFILLALLALSHYFSLKWYLKKKSFWLYLLSLFLPIGFLFITKSNTLFSTLGLSYLVFRLCYMTAETKVAKAFELRPLAYLEFVFYLPIFIMGPIVRYAEFNQQRKDLTQQEILDQLFRIVWGIFKIKVLSAMCIPITFNLLFFDGYQHDLTDFLLAGFADFFLIYLNFSGFMDIMIAASTLVGRRLPENFNLPFYARNIQDFWNRWHITLFAFMRDMFFFPSVKTITQYTGLSINTIVPIMLLVTFFLTGIWHGFSWNYLFYGLFHGVGLLTHNLYSRYLSARLSPADFKAYQLKFVPRILANITTLVFVAISMFFFVNDMKAIHKILTEVLVYSF